MSQATYAVLAYRQPFPDGTPSQEVIEKSEALARELNAVLKKHGAELSTVKKVLEVASAMAKDPERGLGSGTFEDYKEDK